MFKGSVKFFWLELFIFHFNADDGCKDIGLIHQRILDAFYVACTEIFQNPINWIVKTNNEDQQVSDKNTGA
jgi:hypothetical protein